MKMENEARRYLEQALESIESHAWDLLETIIPKLDATNQRLVLSMLQMELEK